MKAEWRSKLVRVCFSIDTSVTLKGNRETHWLLVTWNILSKLLCIYSWIKGFINVKESQSHTRTIRKRNNNKKKYRDISLSCSGARQQTSQRYISRGLLPKDPIFGCATPKHWFGLPNQVRIPALTFRSFSTISNWKKATQMKTTVLYTSSAGHDLSTSIFLRTRLKPESFNSNNFSKGVLIRVDRASTQTSRR